LKELSVNLVPRKLNIPHHRPPDEAVLYTEHVRVLIRVSHRNIGQLNVEVLVNLEKQIYENQDEETPTKPTE
jgi:hypothetical protein